MPLPDILEPPCTVSPYIVTCELERNARGQYDVRVTLQITYHVFDAPKTEGFKFVGDVPVSDISVTDGQGNPLKWKKDIMRETRIRWWFEPVSNGDMTVIVKFKIDDSLSGDLNANYFHAPWIKNFRVKVTDATYRFVFPTGFHPAKVTIAPHTFVAKTLDDGRSAVECKDIVVHAGYFGVSFSPGLADRPKDSIERVVSRYVAQEPTSRDIKKLIIVAVAIMAIVLTRGCSIKRDPNTGQLKFYYTSHRSGIGSSSGCSGCSSCSSCGGCSGCGGCGG